ncbi:hypothetical protein VW29_08995 [Devosia limi DSM 17137]|nr:hypothetical protein VW29_08995 [Devosia limi DSM 17137]
MLAVLTSIFERMQPPVAESELNLDGQPLAERFQRERTDSRFREALAATLELLYRDAGEFQARYFPPFSGGLGETVGQALGDIEIDRAAATDAIKAAINREIDNAMAAQEDMPAQEDAPWYEWASGLWASDGPVGRALEFGRRMSGERADNLEMLFGQYTDGQTPALVAAALVDFSGWLNEQPRSPIADQVRLMDSLQASTPAGQVMQMIVPFNPWRQLAVERNQWSAPDPLSLVREAVTDRGAIGVKLYPPMGFLPMGNARAGLEYPERAGHQFGDDFPALLDESLMRLYELCVELDVPILTHTSHGNAAGADFGRRAHPVGWLPVLAGFPTLRVSMAHFGAFTSETAPADTWEAAIAAIARIDQQQVFVDLSYLTRIMPLHADGANRGIAIAGLRAILQHDDSFADRIVFGSDWHMLSQEPENERYPTLIEGYLRDVGLDAGRIGQVFARNALRLFGLVPGSQAYDRLQRYYGDRGLAHFNTIEALNRL